MICMVEVCEVLFWKCLVWEIFRRVSFFGLLVKRRADCKFIY